MSKILNGHLLHLLGAYQFPGKIWLSFAVVLRQLSCTFICIPKYVHLLYTPTFDHTHEPALILVRIILLLNHIKHQQTLLL
jgi:hypothetical protein